MHNRARKETGSPQSHLSALYKSDAHSHTRLSHCIVLFHSQQLSWVKLSDRVTCIPLSIPKAFHGLAFRTCVCMHVHMYMHVCVCVPACACMHVYMSVLNVCKCVHMCVYMSVFVHECVHICLCVYTFTSTQRPEVNVPEIKCLPLPPPSVLLFDTGSLH